MFINDLMVCRMGISGVFLDHAKCSNGNKMFQINRTS